MAEFKTIPLEKIIVPERLRAVEEDHAFMIGQSIARIGLLNPVTVRPTPRAERPYTLIAGAHRLRGAELAGLQAIEATVVKADKADGQMVEIEENVFRNELSALDRAVFVLRYRELWEEKHGWNKGGRPNAETSANLAEVSEDTAQDHFFERVSERMGLSRRAVERAQQIGRSLTPELRQRLRGTDEADNQSLLLKLAKLDPTRQHQIAIAASDGCNIRDAIEVTDKTSRAQKSAQEELFDRLVATWSRADEATRARFLSEIGVRGA
jgi:ParB family chromosome partitioning protein